LLIVISFFTLYFVYRYFITKFHYQKLTYIININYYYTRKHVINP